MQLIITKYNKGVCVLLCSIIIFSKYAWVVPLKDKKGITISNAFQKFFDESNGHVRSETLATRAKFEGRKPSKVWIKKGSEVYNRSSKSWLQVIDIKIHSTHNEGKSVVAEKFIRSLKNKLYKYMTSTLKNMYIDKLYNIVNKYNNIY